MSFLEASNAACQISSSAPLPSSSPWLILAAVMQASYVHTDILTSLVGMSPSSVQYGLDLPNGQLDTTAGNIRPIYAWNTECLARCGRAAPAPGAAGPTPSALAG